MRGNEITWTDEMKAALCAKWDAGMSLLTIAREINAAFPGCRLTRNAIAGKKKRLHLTDRATPVGIAKPFAQEKLDRIRTMLSNGLTAKQIMARVSVSRARLQELRNEWGFAQPERVRAQATSRVKFPIEMVRPPAAVQAVLVFPLRPSARCCWVDGDNFRNWRHCDAPVVTGPGVKRPHSYCQKHRDIAYAPAMEEAA